MGEKYSGVRLHAAARLSYAGMHFLPLVCAARSACMHNRVAAINDHPRNEKRLLRTSGYS
jgi:hypothetical protein